MVANTKCVHIVRNRKAKEQMAPFRSAGHSDYLAGLPFRPEYETWNEEAQYAYENGRLVAANMKLAGLKVPTWRPGVTRPQGYKDVAIAAEHRVGSAIRQNHLPPNPAWNVPEHAREVIY